MDNHDIHNSQTSAARNMKRKRPSLIKRALSVPVFADLSSNEPFSNASVHSNRFEFGAGERLSEDINKNVIKRRSVISEDFLRKRSLIPKVPENYISDLKKQFHFYTVINKTKLSGQAQEEIDKLLGKPEVNGGPKILIERSVFSQKHFDESYEATRHAPLTLRQVLRKKLSRCACSLHCVKNFLFTLFPFIQIMRDYSVRQDLSGDIVSGLTVGIMHIPQGMAYGMLTTLPPVYGLYMSFFPVLIYFFFGSSRHVSMGTFAVACLMIGSAVNKGLANVHIPVPTSKPGVVLLGNLTGNQTNSTTTASPGGAVTGSSMSPEELDLRLQFAMSVTFAAGIIQLLMGMFRLGFITVYLSDPLISGFTTGAACHVFTSQIKHVFGIKTARYSGVFKLVYTYRDFFSKITSANYVTILLSIVCMVILYCTSRFINQNPKLKAKMFMPVPIELIVVILGTVISYAIKLEDNYNVVVVSDIPTGLPAPSMHPVTRLPAVISDAVALAIVIFAISISMGKLLAKRHDYEVDANQELVAIGISTVVSSFLSSGAPSASLSRSLIQEKVGGKTQIAGLVSCCLLLVVLLAIGPYFSTLPNCVMASTIIVALDGMFAQFFTVPRLWITSKWDFCVLASIIIVALRGMFLQVLDLKKLWHVALIDFSVWIVAFVATVLLDVDLGLGVAVVFNMLTVVVRSQRPYVCVLGQIPGTDLYRDVNLYHEAREIPGIKIFRFEQSLFFVNTEHFKSHLYKKTINPRKVKFAMKRRDKLLSNQKKQDVGADKDEMLEEAVEVAVKSGSSDVKVMVVADNNPKCPPDVHFHTIVLDCSPWSFVDSMGVKVLTSVICEYKQIGVTVILANCKGGIRAMFEKTKFYDTVDHSNMYVSVHDAVLHALHLEALEANEQTEDISSDMTENGKEVITVNFDLSEESEDKSGKL